MVKVKNEGVWYEIPDTEPGRAIPEKEPVLMGEGLTRFEPEEEEIKPGEPSASEKFDAENRASVRSQYLAELAKNPDDVAGVRAKWDRYFPGIIGHTANDDLKEIRENQAVPDSGIFEGVSSEVLGNKLVECLLEPTKNKNEIELLEQELKSRGK